MLLPFLLGLGSGYAASQYTSSKDTVPKLTYNDCLPFQRKIKSELSTIYKTSIALGATHEEAYFICDVLFEYANRGLAQFNRLEAIRKAFSQTLAAKKANNTAAMEQAGKALQAALGPELWKKLSPTL